MNELHIEQARLAGEVSVSGAKNSVLKLLAASILSDQRILIDNVPQSLLDVRVHLEMLEAVGKRITIDEERVLIVDGDPGLSPRLDWSGRSIRNTLLILGALTARLGQGAVPLPGGCKLGDRAYDIHLMLLRALGAEVWEEDGLLMASAPTGLIGTDIQLPVRSTGATENAILCGCLAKGITRIWNPHVRPEILDLIQFLNAMGATITVYGQEHIAVEGVSSFNPVQWRVMPDNMEAITWLCASVMTNGDIEILDFPTRDLEVALIHLKASGAKLYEGNGSLIVKGGRCFPLEISTGPHPAINSDVQPILAAFASCANGESRITDLRFRGRYGYANEFTKMGVNCIVDGDMLRIQGNGGRLRGAVVRAVDLRAGAALALCGLVATGTTVIQDAWQIQRGYNNFADKLSRLGARIHVVE